MRIHVIDTACNRSDCRESKIEVFRSAFAMRLMLLSAAYWVCICGFEFGTKYSKSAVTIPLGFSKLYQFEFRIRRPNSTTVHHATCT